MIDYLTGMLEGRDDGVEAQFWDQSSREWISEVVVAVDAVGLVLKRVGSLDFKPWHSVSRLRIKD